MYSNHFVPWAWPPHTVHRANCDSLDIQSHTCSVQHFNWDQVNAATQLSTSSHLIVHSSHCTQQWVWLSQQAHFQQKALTYPMSSSPKWQHLPFLGSMVRVSAAERECRLCPISCTCQNFNISKCWLWWHAHLLNCWVHTTHLNAKIRFFKNSWNLQNLDVAESVTRSQKCTATRSFLPSKLSRQSIMSEQVALHNSASLSTHHASQCYKPLKKLKKQAISVSVLTIKTPSAWKFILKSVGRRVTL